MNTIVNSNSKQNECATSIWFKSGKSEAKRTHLIFINPKAPNSLFPNESFPTFLDFNFHDNAVSRRCMEKALCWSVLAFWRCSRFFFLLLVQFILHKRQFSTKHGYLVDRWKWVESQIIALERWNANFNRISSSWPLLRNQKNLIIMDQKGSSVIWKNS